MSTNKPQTRPASRQSVTASLDDRQRGEDRVGDQQRFVNAETPARVGKLGNTTGAGADVGRVIPVGFQFDHSAYQSFLTRNNFGCASFQG